MPSPTQRTLKKLRDENYCAAITEKWNAYSKVRQDLFNFADLVAVRSDLSGVLAIQTTSGSNASARRTKILANPIAKVWLEAKNRIEVWSWAKRGKRGKRKLWQVRIDVIHLGDFDDSENPNSD